MNFEFEVRKSNSKIELGIRSLNPKYELCIRSSKLRIQRLNFEFEVRNFEFMSLECCLCLKFRLAKSLLRLLIKLNGGSDYFATDRPFFFEFVQKVLRPPLRRAPLHGPAARTPAATAVSWWPCGLELALDCLVRSSNSKFEIRFLGLNSKVELRIRSTKIEFKD